VPLLNDLLMLQHFQGKSNKKSRGTYMETVRERGGILVER